MTKPNFRFTGLKAFYILAFLLLPLVSLAQNTDDAKQLEVKLAAETNPVKKMSRYLDLIDVIEDYDSVATEKYVTEAFTLAGKLNDKKSAVDLYRMRGIMYTNFNNFPKALASFNQGLELARSINQKLMMADIYNSISNVYTLTDKLKLRDEYLLKALKIFEELHSERDIAIVYANMGANYSNQGDYANSVKFLLRSLAIREKLKNNNEIALTAFKLSVSYKLLKRYDDAIKYNELSITKFTLVNNEGMVGMSFAVKGSILRSLNRFDEALSYINKAIPLFEKYKNTQGLLNSYDNIGLIYVAKNDRAKALPYFIKSHNLSVAQQRPQGIVSSDINIADVAYVLGDMKTVGASLKEAEPIARKNKLKEDLSELFKLKVQYLIAINNHSEANKAFNDYMGVKDSLSNSDINRQITEMQTKYETEKKDNQIKLLSTEQQIDRLKLKQRNILIVAFAILLLVVAFAAYANYNRYKAKQEARLQAEVHKQQEIETRSLFEGEQKERIRIARDLHDSIGQMLSVIKMNVSNIQHEQPENKMTGATLDLVDSTITEVRNISHNLIPEELNFGLFNALEDMCDKINLSNTTQVSMNVPDEVKEHQFEKSNELSIYRIVQEVLNNMVKHSEASQIAIDVVQNANTFTIAIKDNGKGFDTAQINKSKGLGWKNIAARVNLLDGQMQVRSEQLTGTQIEITIPSA